MDEQLNFAEFLEHNSGHRIGQKVSMSVASGLPVAFRMPRQAAPRRGFRRESAFLQSAPSQRFSPYEQWDPLAFSTSPSTTFKREPVIDPPPVERSSFQQVLHVVRCVFKLPMYLLGTMQETASLLKKMRAKQPVLVLPLLFIDASLRGVGQIFFQNSPMTGLIIIVAMFVGGWWEGVCSLLGLVCSTFTAVLFGMNSATVENGLYGYNGFLCGSAMALFLEGPWVGSTVVAIVFSSIFSSVCPISHYQCSTDT